jgi:hypothetical protein
VYAVCTLHGMKFVNTFTVIFGHDIMDLGELYVRQSCIILKVLQSGLN